MGSRGIPLQLLAPAEELVIAIKPTTILPSIHRCLADLPGSGNFSSVRDTLTALVGAISDHDVIRIGASCELLNTLTPHFAPSTDVLPLTLTVPRSRWTIFAVEDMPEWKTTLRSVFEVARDQLIPTTELHFKEFSNCQDVQKDLDEAAVNSARLDSNPILIMDLGIPRTAEHLAAHQAGRDLLAYSRRKLGIPVIVLTTPHNFLGDHLMAFRLGVSDYILKGLDAERALLQALLRVLRRKALER